MVGVPRLLVRSTPRLWSTALLIGVAAVIGAARGAYGVACNDIDDQCTVANTGTCQTDGSCQGTAVADDTPCDNSFEASGCATAFHCKSGRCVATDPKPNGTSCSVPFLKCIERTECRDGLCTPVQFQQCPPSGNPCAPNVCNVLTGACASVAIPCVGPCSTGQCNPSTGDCSFAPDTTACDDGDPCTSGDHCHAGDCVGGGGQVPTAPPTATGRTATATSAVHTPTATVTPSPLVTATKTGGTTPGGCVGDCDNDHHVTVDELVKGVNIALGTALLSECAQLDSDTDKHVTVDELVQGVNAALNGCPQGATPTRIGASATPSATPTGLPATPIPSATGVPPTVTRTATLSPTGLASVTATPSPNATLGAPSVARRVSGATQGITNAALVIPNLLSALLGPASTVPGLSMAGQSAALPTPTPLITLPFSCPGGGGGTLSCSQEIVIGFPPKIGPPTYQVTAKSCKVNAAAGLTEFNGTIALTGSQGDICGLQIPDTVTVNSPLFTIVTQGDNGSTTATLINLVGSVALSGSDDQCRFSEVLLQLTGKLAVVSKDAAGATLTQTELQFGSGSSVDIVVSQYGDQCVPTIYTMTLDGDFVFTTDGNSISATLANYMISDDATSGTNLIDVEGDITSSCLGATTVTVSTDPLALLAVTSGRPCPTAGLLQIQSDSLDAATYTASGGVEIDLGNDETIDERFLSCLDPRLYQCPES